MARQSKRIGDMARFRNGWVKVSRSMGDGQYDAIDIGFMTWLIISANHVDGRSKINGKAGRKIVKRGQLLTSAAEISAALNLGRQVVRTRLHIFSTEGFLNQETTNQGTLITILNYDEYQCSESNHEQPTNQQLTSNQPHIEECKNINTRIHTSNKPPVAVAPDACQEVVDGWNHVLDGVLPKVARCTPKRQKLINAQLKKYPDISYWKNIFELVRSSDFLTGKTGTWKCGFDWILNENNRTKVEEGNYANKQKSVWSNSGYGEL